MVKPIVTRGLRLARVLFVIVMIIGALGVPFFKMGDSIEPIRAYAAYHKSPSDVTRRAFEDANARDVQRRVRLMSVSAMIFGAAAVGVLGVTVALRTQTI